MDSRLFMEIGFVNSTFQAIDRSPYERWINDGVFDDSHQHLVLQRLISVKDGENNAEIKFSQTVAESADETRGSFEVENITNGLYYYQKLVLPLEDHVSTSNERLYFDGNSVIFEDLDTNTTQTLSPHTDFDEIYDLVRDEYPDNCFSFDDYSFTIYDLIECYVLTERERINNYLKNNCNGNCGNGSIDLNTNADILLAAIMVIKDLIEKEDYFEAQRILNGLNTCGNLCKKFSKNLKGCGCGRS